MARFLTKTNGTSKRGPPYLRRTLFVIMDILIRLQPQDDPVYQFLDKKRAEGKPYYYSIRPAITVYKKGQNMLNSKEKKGMEESKMPRYIVNLTSEEKRN